MDGNYYGFPSFYMGDYEKPSPELMPPITTANATPLAWPHLHDHRDSYRCGRQFRYCDDHLQCSQITISPER